ncbi:hypothetical protein LMH73_023400 [Vibrio splendidus]|nr:hypothetical protein [Vibrio splendidus]MCC4882514.1 hypothetical protein [Vibrio splendidus]
MNITWNNFTKRNMANNRYRSRYTFESYKKAYSGSDDLRAWLEENANTAPDLKFVNSLVKTYIKEFGRVIGDIPHLLVLLSRQYNIEVPTVPGILTNQYWEDKLSIPATASF